MPKNPKALPSVDFSSWVARGENPGGMVAQTSNGTIHEGRGGDGSQYRFGGRADGGWNEDPMPRDPMTGGYAIGIGPAPKADPVFVRRRRG